MYSAADNTTAVIAHHQASIEIYMGEALDQPTTTWYHIILPSLTLYELRWHNPRPTVPRSPQLWPSYTSALLLSLRSLLVKQSVCKLARGHPSCRRMLHSHGHPLYWALILYRTLKIWRINPLFMCEFSNQILAFVCIFQMMYDGIIILFLAYYTTMFSQRNERR